MHHRNVLNAANRLNLYMLARRRCVCWDCEIVTLWQTTTMDIVPRHSEVSHCW